MSFIHHATACGLIVDYPIADGRWHRCRTEDKPRKRNGAYIFDGQRGAVRNWATMPDYAIYRDQESGRVNVRDFREQMRRNRQEQDMRHQAAAELAKDMLARAVLDRHPYLKRKGFPDEQGLVLDGELLISMRECSDYRKLNGLQRIDSEGQKLFLAGSKAQGSIFKLGSDFAHARWLVEGMATGLSVRAALRDLRRSAQVIICFSAGNLTHVAPKVKRPAHVFADHDVSEAGQKAAAGSGLPWVMAPEPGDANDWHQRYGLRALVKVLTGSNQQ